MTNESYTPNVEFHLDVKLDESDMSVVELSGILQICLLKYIARNIVNVNNITSNEIKNIITNLKNTMVLNNKPVEDIKSNLMQKEGSNITEIDLDYIDEVRAKLPLMSARRRDIYSLMPADEPES